MATLLRVPEIAAGATEAVLSQWLVGENTPFAAGEPIVVLETDKASVEMEAETDAVIVRALVSGGATVEVGSPMAVLAAKDEQVGDIDALLAELGVPSAVPETVPETTPPAAPQTVAENGAAKRIFASPLARKLLKEAGLSLDTVRGTGPGGRIVRRDVEQAVAQAVAHARQAGTDVVPEVPAEPPVTRSAEPLPHNGFPLGFREIPHSRLRRAVANRLTASKQTIPHFYLKRTARIDALLDLRKRLNEVSATKISVNDLVLRAVAVAHRAVPEANVVWADDALRQFESVDIAVAIASERGLVTPVLRAVEKATPSAIAAQVKAYVAQAGDGKLRQHDLEGGSISVTNLGMFGVEEFSAIINPPHSAILAVGAGVQAPVVVDGTVEVATQLALVLSVDHRAIDGALAARWMGVLVTTLEEPLRLLA
ncbi:dihydrolipoamide acetyltransferase family protein [Amycolatopsis pigmentata]|uniref:Dihydrolipoamide acetyltransferase component of pyruvate dehydrogenase complex n=1 Tax=Amycolatopsis pigmentata TaxID=450801 RepID=A0ABW5FJK2_9PSEU